MKFQKMKAPTKKIKLRGNDPTGNGWYGARRSNGRRKHNGVDYCAKAGEPIFACISGRVRIGYPYVASTKMKLVEIKNKEYKVKQMYVEPTVKNRDYVKAGDLIGYSQDVANYHGISQMKNHVHISVWKNGLLTDPEPLIGCKL